MKKMEAKVEAAKKGGVRKIMAKRKHAVAMATITTKKSAKAAAPASVTAEAGSVVLDRLYATIIDRRTADPARSHSARLLSRGPAKIAQKFGEEAVECLIEAVAGNPAALIAESSDVLYHLLVMWVATGVTPEQVWQELQHREGISGIAEKASRAQGTRKIP